MRGARALDIAYYTAVLPSKSPATIPDSAELNQRAGMTKGQNPARFLGSSLAPSAFPPHTAAYMPAHCLRSNQSALQRRYTDCKKRRTLPYRTGQAYVCRADPRSLVSMQNADQANSMSRVISRLSNLNAVLLLTFAPFVGKAYTD